MQIVACSTAAAGSTLHCCQPLAESGAAGAASGSGPARASGRHQAPPPALAAIVSPCGHTDTVPAALARRSGVAVRCRAQGQAERERDGGKSSRPHRRGRGLERRPLPVRQPHHAKHGVRAVHEREPDDILGPPARVQEPLCTHGRRGGNLGISAPRRAAQGVRGSEGSSRRALVPSIGSSTQCTRLSPAPGSTPRSIAARTRASESGPRDEKRDTSAVTCGQWETVGPQQAQATSAHAVIPSCLPHAARLGEQGGGTGRAQRRGVLLGDQGNRREARAELEGEKRLHGEVRDGDRGLVRLAHRGGLRGGAVGEERLPHLDRGRDVAGGLV